MLSRVALGVAALAMPEFDYWWNRRGEAVELFNERRGGQSGVERVCDSALGLVYIKRQTNHVFYNLSHPFGRPTLTRELAGYLLFATLGLKTPDIVFIGTRKTAGEWQAIMVTKNLEGFVNLRDWYQNKGPDHIGPEAYQAFLRDLGNKLGLLHRHRWCHGSLNFAHIYVAAGQKDKIPEIAFLDLEKSRRRLTSNSAAKRDLRTLKRRGLIIDGKAALNDNDWSVLLDAHQQSLASS